MTIRDVCDLAYVLLVDQLDRQTTADWQAAAFARAISGEGDLPDLAQRMADQREAFDAALAADPDAAKHIDPDQLALRRALGVA